MYEPWRLATYLDGLWLVAAAGISSAPGGWSVLWWKRVAVAPGIPGYIEAVWTCVFKRSRCTYYWTSLPISQLTAAFGIVEWQQSCGFQPGKAVSCETELWVPDTRVLWIVSARLSRVCLFRRHVAPVSWLEYDTLPPWNPRTVSDVIPAAPCVTRRHRSAFSRRGTLLLYSPFGCCISGDAAFRSYQTKH